MKTYLNLIIPVDPLKKSVWKLHRMLEIFLTLQVWFVLYIDLWCGYITTCLPYWVFLVVLHILFSFIFSTKSALCLEKRRSRYTTLETLYIDLKEFGTQIAPFVLELIVFLFCGSLYLFGLISVLEFIELSQAYALVFSLCFSFFVNLVVLSSVYLKSLSLSASASAEVPFKKKFLNIYLLKKLTLFKQKTQDKPKQFFVYFFLSLAFVNVFQPLPLVILGFSLVFDFGRSICCFYFLMSFITYLFTFDKVLSYIKNLYGKEVLRLLI